MTVGLPGVGLGGIFYIVSAALMPVRELVRAARRERPPRWSLVWKQTTMVAGILAALWLTGWWLGLVIAASPTVFTTSGHEALRSTTAHNVLRVSALALSLGTLVFVLASVQIARLFVKRPEAKVSGLPAIGQTRETPTSGDEPASSSRSQRVDSGTFGRAR